MYRRLPEKCLERSRTQQTDYFLERTSRHQHELIIGACGPEANGYRAVAGFQREIEDRAAETSEAYQILEVRLLID
jgi:hypothetical protein